MGTRWASPKMGYALPPPGCWWHTFPMQSYLNKPVANGYLDCDCHLVSPRRCNPGPPPFPDSMTEFMGLPPPPKQRHRPNEYFLKDPPVLLDNPYPVDFSKGPKRRDLSDLMPEDIGELAYPDTNDTIIVHRSFNRRDEPVDPDAYSYAPVPFNGVAPPVEALMPDEIGPLAHTRSTYYNRRLEEIHFNGNAMQTAVWHANKYLSFKPQLTLYRLWVDNVTYTADWDPRVALNTLSAGVIRNILDSTKSDAIHERDSFGEAVSLMPSRHVYALQYCAKRAVDRVVDDVGSFFHLKGKNDELWATKNAGYMVYVMELYELWKEVTGLDHARLNFMENAPSQSEPAERSSDHPPYRKPDSNIPWNPSPYREKVKQAKKPPSTMPWEPVPPAGEAVPWDFICDSVHEAHFSWATMNERKFRPRFPRVVEAWKILGPQLAELGHAGRADRIMRLPERLRQRGDRKSFMLQNDMCSTMTSTEACVKIGHAMNMLTLAIYQQVHRGEESK